ncbi:hypothetical protein NDA16_003756 [Ustilago loliicola]|nr:hypothetical protein NDA16_003756 [Ustilago loliicola]
MEIPKTPSSAYSDVDPFMLCNRDVWGEFWPSPSGRSSSSGAGGHGAPRDPFGLAPPFREANNDFGASVESSTSSLFNAHASPPLSPSSAHIVRTQDDEQAALHSALATDVVQSKALVNVLFPALKRDKGRILGLVPCGHGPELPQDPDTLSLQSVPTRGRSGKSRDRSLSSSSSSNDQPQRSNNQADSAAILRTWPSPVVNTVREALRTQYRELELEYRRRGGAAKQVHVSMIETNPLIKLPQTRLKKVVKWNDFGSRYHTKPSMLFTGLNDDLSDEQEAPDFPFSTASSGPAYTMLNLKPTEGPAVRVARTYPRELTHQDPTPLFEAIRCALTSYHPRAVYYPALSAWVASFVQATAPWVQLDLKGLLASYLLKYAVEDQGC